MPIEEEERLVLGDVLERVRAALQPEAEFDLFAKWPKYAAASDRLAAAVKASEPGAMHRFIEHHMRLCGTSRSGPYAGSAWSRTMRNRRR